MRKARRTDGRDRGHGDVERYEQLRTRALVGAPDGFRLGLAILERRGLAAWVRAITISTPPVPTAHARTKVIELPTNARQIVDALATIALAAAG
jgi:hypothetical protein